MMTENEWGFVVGDQGEGGCRSSIPVRGGVCLEV